MNIESLKFRTEVKRDDLENVRDILHSSGFFYDFEMSIAIELVENVFETGGESHYHFLFAEVDGRTAGYTCFGYIPCTKHSWELYWIGVHNDCRGSGVGKMLMAETEKIIKNLGGKGVYIETSSREKYIPTQKFYNSCGCELVARIKDFYDDGDDKMIYKRIV
ncbi:MAG: GNAT family N-acetyltransferase [Bacteroidales bacterium]